MHSAAGIDSAYAWRRLAVSVATWALLLSC